MIRELADGIWSCEQDDGPRIVRQVVIAGDEAVLLVDTGLPGVAGGGAAAAGGAARRARAGRAHHAPRQRSPRRDGRAAGRSARTRACSPARSICRSSATPSG